VFEHKIQLALIDGPHAYPFPDLEYFYLYPHLDTGAILIIDDIHIPTIQNLFRFLRADDMFQLEEVVGVTAFFTRTSSPVFDPAGDSWQAQKYNQRMPFRNRWRSAVASAVPTWLRRLLREDRPSPRLGMSCSVEILSPAPGDTVPSSGTVSGTASLAPGTHLWVLARRVDQSNWWPQGGGPVRVENGRWASGISYGEPRDAGFAFEIAAVVVGRAVHEVWLGWVDGTTECGAFPAGISPESPNVLTSVVRTVRKSK
jgi:hypothetical protein